MIGINVLETFNPILFISLADIGDNIFQQDIPKSMQQIKSYDGIFQATRALTVYKTLKTIILSHKFLHNENFFLFSLKCFDSNRTS